MLRSAAIAVLELLDDVGIRIGANQQVDLARQSLDGAVVAGELLRRRQRAHRAVDFVERALDAAERFLIAAALAAALDLLAQRTDFGLERIDRLARQRFGERAADFRQLFAERRNRLIQVVRAAQRLHLAGQVVELPLDAGEIDRCGGRRERRCRGRRRRRRMLHERIRCRRVCRAVVQRVAARGNLGDRRIHACGAERRRGVIGGVLADFSSGALDRIEALSRIARWRGPRLLRRLRQVVQPRVEARDRIVQLIGKARGGGRARHAGAALRHMIDLPRDAVEPLMNFGEAVDCACRHRRRGRRVRLLRRRRRVSALHRCGLGDLRVEPLTKGHSGRARGAGGGFCTSVGSARIHA